MINRPGVGARKQRSPYPFNAIYGIPAIFVLAWLLVLSGCNDHNAPDTSNIKVDIEVARFDKFLFEKVDTANLPKGLAEMQKAFPQFTNDFLFNILGLPPIGAEANDSLTLGELKRFMRLTRPVYDSIAPKFNNMAPLEKDLSQAFRYVKYYFPNYKVPQVIAYTGPFDAPAIAITNSALAIGLQLFAGKNFSFYMTPEGQQLYPLYLSRRFEPQYIPANCMNAVSQDIYPDNSKGRPLIEQMIEKGKQWYLVDLFLPGAADSLKTGFTERQLSWCRDNEGVIWNFILQGSDLYTTEPSIINNFIGDAPTTQGMPDVSPGNIGQWIGRQIIKSYVKKKPGITPAELIKIPSASILAEAKYKPR